MELEDLRWKRESSLRDMMDNFNRLVDAMAQISDDITKVERTVSEQHLAISDEFHTLTDRILTVNYKTDEMKQDIHEKLDDILRRINRNHPTS